MVERAIKSFEDLHVYKLAREFNRKVGKLIKNLPEQEKYNLASQMRRAKLSVTNNLAEGYGRYHYQESIQYYRQSRGSVYEIIDDFNECFDEGYIDEASRKELKDYGYQLIKILNSFIKSIKKAQNSDK